MVSVIYMFSHEIILFISVEENNDTKPETMPQAVKQMIGLMKRTAAWIEDQTWVCEVFSSN